jgi:hypothetical protein
VSQVDPVVFRNGLLFVGVAGVLLLFSREWPVRLAGLFLMLPRILFAPLTSEDLLIFGGGATLAAVRLGYWWARGRPDARRQPAPIEDPEPDDTSEPSPCPACGGVIPARADRCSACGWTYTDRH